MDLVDQMEAIPTAAELKVRRLQKQLDELTTRGEEWTEGGIKVWRQLELARISVRLEGSS